jgi:hypothetical protein
VGYNEVGVHGGVLGRALELALEQEKKLGSRAGSGSELEGGLGEGCGSEVEHSR